MPITIKELHIKINVDENSKSKEVSPIVESTKEIIASCVEEVMDILERQKQR